MFHAYVHMILTATGTSSTLNKHYISGIDKLVHVHGSNSGYQLQLLKLKGTQTRQPWSH